MDRTCTSQSPVTGPLSSTRISMSKKVEPKRARGFRQARQTSAVATMPLLLFICVFLMGMTGSLVDALLPPNPITLEARRTNSRNAKAMESSCNLLASRDSLAAIVRSTTALSAEKGPKKQGKAQGVYVRPSGAIEKGSGFFVPGLEGPKVRLVIGLVLLLATAVNHLLLGDVGSFGSAPQAGEANGEEFLSFSETAAVLYSVLLLFQSAIEYAKEALPEEIQSGATKKSSFSAVGDATEVLEQTWSNPSSTEKDDASYRSRVQWAAASYVSMTPTTQIMLLADGGVQYRLGSQARGSDASAGVVAALDELSNSKGGRIALPMTHPAVTALLGGGEEESAADGNKLRTVILQRITDDSCWMVSSDQLLAGYTGGDLKWLGKLAGYVAATE